MERVTFLIEKSGERVSCLLNPASVVTRRLAGVQPRQTGTGPLTGAGVTDDPLLYTGGGTTEILLDLLFDTSVVLSPSEVGDVRTLTRPLTELAEGKEDTGGYSQVPLVRFVWGKSWNVLGVVAAFSERLESFTPEGAPQRSWLRMRLLRVPDVAADPAETVEDLSLSDLPEEINIPTDELQSYQVKGGGEDSNNENSNERLDEIAASCFGNPSL